MAVKILIDRKIKPRARPAVFDLMRRMRQRCLEEPGYISGETLRDNNDENHIVVISVWFGLMDWKRWAASDDRKRFVSQIEEYLTEPENLLVTLEGFSDDVSGA